MTGQEWLVVYDDLCLSFVVSVTVTTEILLRMCKRHWTVLYQTSYILKVWCNWPSFADQWLASCGAESKLSTWSFAFTIQNCLDFDVLQFLHCRFQ